MQVPALYFEIQFTKTKKKEGNQKKKEMSYKEGGLAMIIKCKRIQCGSRLWLEMEIDCEKNNGPPTAKHYDANHE